MKLSNAKQAEREGRCVIYNGEVHFYDTPSDAGYDSGPAVYKWAGRQSGYAGPNVMQAIRA